MTIEAERRDWFASSRVVDRAVSAFRATWPIGLASVLLLVVAPQMFGYWLDGPAGLLTITGRAFDGAFAGGPGAFDAGPAAFAVLAAVLGVFCQALLVMVALASFRGERLRLGEALGAGLRLLPAALGIAILTTLGILLGLLLLIVPGLMLMTIWMVSLPVQAHGRPGVIAAIQESGELTKGVRWQVFFLVVGTSLAIGFANWLIGIVPRMMPEVLPVSLQDIDAALLQPVFDGVSALAMAYGSASLFHELKWGGRLGHEEAAAEVFA